MARRRKADVQVARANAVELEGKRMADNAWYDCHVSISSNGLQGKTLDVNFSQFEADDNEKIFSESEAMARVRARSALVENGQCRQVQDGDMVLASQSLQLGKSQFYDALVEKVHRQRHSSRVSCKCSFELTWVNRDMKGETFTVPASHIRKLAQYSIWDHPVISEWVKYVQPVEKHFQSLPVQQSPPESEMGSEIQAQLAEEIEKITIMADSFSRSHIANEALQDTAATVRHHGRRKALAGSKRNGRKMDINTSEAPPKRSSLRKRVQPNIMPVSNNEQEDTERAAFISPDKKPRLSPLAARAALAAAVQDLPLENLLLGDANVPDMKDQNNASTSKRHLHPSPRESSRDGDIKSSSGLHGTQRGGRRGRRNQKGHLHIVPAHPCTLDGEVTQQVTPAVKMPSTYKQLNLNTVRASPEPILEDDLLTDRENHVPKTGDLADCALDDPCQPNVNMKKKEKTCLPRLPVRTSTRYRSENRAPLLPENQQLALGAKQLEGNYLAISKTSMLVVDKLPTEALWQTEQCPTLTEREEGEYPCRRTSKGRKTKKLAFSVTSAQLNNHPEVAAPGAEQEPDKGGNLGIADKLPEEALWQTEQQESDVGGKLGIVSCVTAGEKPNCGGDGKSSRKRSRITRKANKVGNIPAPHARDTSDASVASVEDEDVTIKGPMALTSKDTQSKTIRPTAMINLTVELVTGVQDTHDSDCGNEKQSPISYKVKARARHVSFDALPVGFGLGISGWPPSTEVAESPLSLMLLEGQTEDKVLTEDNVLGSTIKLIPNGQESTRGRVKDSSTVGDVLLSPRFNARCDERPSEAVLPYTEEYYGDQGHAQDLKMFHTSMEGRFLKKEVLSESGPKTRKKVTFASNHMQSSTSIDPIMEGKFMKNEVLYEPGPKRKKNVAFASSHMQSSTSIGGNTISSKAEQGMTVMEETKSPSLVAEELTACCAGVLDTSPKQLDQEDASMGNLVSGDAISIVLENKLARKTRFLSAFRSPALPEPHDTKRVDGNKRRGTPLRTSTRKKPSRK